MAGASLPSVRPPHRHATPGPKDHATAGCSAAAHPRLPRRSAHQGRSFPRLVGRRRVPEPRRETEGQPDATGNPASTLGDSELHLQAPADGLPSERKSSRAVRPRPKTRERPIDPAREVVRETNTPAPFIHPADAPRSMLRRVLPSRPGSCPGLNDADSLACPLLPLAEESGQAGNDPIRHLAAVQELMASHCSVEHRYLVDVVIARVCAYKSEVSSGWDSARPGRRLARDAGYRILDVERARSLLPDGHIARAAAATRAAIANDATCGYVWGSYNAAANLALATAPGDDGNASRANADFRRRLAPPRDNP